MFKKLTIFSALVLFLANPLGVFADLIDVPEPTGYVNDFENILDNDELIESKISAFQQETSNEIAVVTVKDFQGLTIEEFAVELFEDWGIGTDENDNGVLVIISSTQRESRIEVGYGLEGALPDALTGRIQDTEMIPYFKNNDYSTGVYNGVEAIISATAGEYTNTTSVEQISEDNDFDPLVLFIIILIFIFLFKKLGLLGLGTVYSAMANSSGTASAIRSFGGSSSRSSSFGGSSGGFGGFGGGRSGGGGSSRSW